jgi:regulator of sigma E protease
MLLTIVIFFVALGLLVLVHEIGHFFIAKKSGIGVEEFGLGFPPRLFSFRRKDTLYSINLVPLGGFVKIKGENGENALEQDSFGSKKKSVRAAVLAGGVLMNVILAFFILSIGFMFGLPAAVDNSTGKYNGHLSDDSVKISGVMKNSPATIAGLKPGDRIMTLAGEKVTSATQVTTYVQKHPEEMTMIGVVSADGVAKTLIFRPDFVAGQSDKKVLGVNIIQAGILHYGFWESWYQGAVATVRILGQIFSTLGQLLKGLFVDTGVGIDLTGPLGVAVMTGQAKDMGWIYLWQFVAMLSLNLAVVNILPFPALDGGRLLFLLIEAIRRKPNNQKVEAVSHNLGFALLMVLIVMVTYKDVLRYGSGAIDKVKNLF